MNASRKSITIFVVTLLTIATFVFLGFWYIGQEIGRFYHPNSIEGRYGSKYLWVFELAIFLNWLYIIYVAIRGVAETKLKKLGVSTVIFLLLIVGFYAANLIPRNYHVNYYLGQERYSIPWQYNPINGSAIPGGNYFVIHVSFPEFTGQYENQNYYERQMTLSKNILDEKNITGIAIDDPCIALSKCGGVDIIPDASSNTYFVDNGFIYLVHYQGKTISFQNNGGLEKFKESVVDLFDSFKTE